MYDFKAFALKILKEQIITRCQDSRYGQRDSLYESAANMFWDSCVDSKGVMTLGKAKLPDIRWFYGWRIWPYMYADTMLIHQFFDDDYSVDNNLLIERDLGCEGPYGFEDITVVKGDVVIDAGAYIGDWTAVAAQKAKQVFAFEPSPLCVPILKQTAILNNFTVVEEGLGEVLGTAKLNMNIGAASDVFSDQGTVPCKVNTIDNFARTNNLNVSFIKSDIEGFERYMLKGAAEVIRRDEPNLAIRTYHYPEDPKLLEDIVRTINPKYKFIHTGHTMFATTRKG